MYKKINKSMLFCTMLCTAATANPCMCAEASYNESLLGDTSAIVSLGVGSNACRVLWKESEDTFSFTSHEGHEMVFFKQYNGQWAARVMDGVTGNMLGVFPVAEGISFDELLTLAREGADENAIASRLHLVNDEYVYVGLKGLKGGDCCCGLGIGGVLMLGMGIAAGWDRSQNGPAITRDEEAGVRALMMHESREQQRRYYNGAYVAP